MTRRPLAAVVRRLARPPAADGEAADAALLARFAATGDEPAFAELLRRHGPLVWAVCRQSLPDPADADDAVQATFLALVRSARTVRAAESLGPWLHAVAVRAAARVRRDAGRRRRRERAAAVPEAARPVPATAWDHLLAVVHDEVRRLPAAQRAAFVLCELQGVPAPDAAARLGCSPGALAVRRAKARSRLLDRLARRDLTAGTAAVGVAATAATAAIPDRLFNMLAGVCGPGKVASPALLALATEAVPMTASRLALTVAAVLAAGGVALGLAAIPRPASPAPAASEPAARLEGTVTAADGSPAAGAAVWAARYALGPLVRRETTADAAGKYALALDPGEWSVWAGRGTQGSEGTGPNLRRDFAVAAGVAPTRVDIRLEERGRLAGRLVEAGTGKPVAGGRLFLDAGRVLTADRDGRFAVGGLARTHHEAFAVAPGRARTRVLFDTTAAAVTELEVPLPPAARLVGRVTDPAGRPIPGAYVGRSTSGSVFSINGLYQACDADGRFGYDDAAPAGQPTRLTAAAPGYQSDQKDGLVAEPGVPLGVEFKLVPEPAADAPAGSGRPARRVVSGTVRDPEGRPVAGALVRWGCQPYTGATTATTDAAGAYRLTVPDEVKRLAVLPRGFTPAFPEVSAGGDQTADVTVAAGRTVRGSVVGEDGRPIANVCVTPVIGLPDLAVFGSFWLTEAIAYTDAAGRFELTGVPDGARFDFLKEGLSPSRNRTLGPDAAANRITLLGGGAIKGRVVGPDGSPVRNFRILVHFPRRKEAGEETAGYFAGYSGIGVRFTSADGSFVLTGVGAGSVYRVQAVADGLGPAVLDRVSAVPVGRLDRTEPAVIKAAPPVKLTVTATGPGGTPVAGALVTLVDGQPGLDRNFSWGYHDGSWENMERGRTDAGGAAVFPALAFGEATVLVQAPGFARRRVGWRDGAAELAVPLEPEAVLAGVVRAAAGELAGGFHVSLSNRGGDHVSVGVAADAGGRFRVAGLPAGRWQVSVQPAGDFRPARAVPVELTTGQVTEWALDWKP